MGLFLCRLTPPRPSFAADMTEDEQALMQKHFAYWQGLLDEGRVVAYGPVADPAGGWGVSIVEGEDQAVVHGIVDRDPVCLEGGNGFRYEIFAMPGAISR